MVQFQVGAKTKLEKGGNMFPKFIKFVVYKEKRPPDGIEYVIIGVALKKNADENYGKIWTFIAFQASKNEEQNIAEVNFYKKLFLRSHEIIDVANNRKEKCQEAIVIEEDNRLIIDYYPPCMV